MSLDGYRRKRDFEKTAEPSGREEAKRGARYVIQKHAASRLHYDFRLELDGVLKSWAVPKGPSLDPNVKVLAVHVEDHPLEYGTFEGVIPKGQYGGGTVMLWDHGTWEPEGDPVEAYRRGKLVFRLFGARLRGRWTLIRMGGKAGDGGKNWLLKKLDDDESASMRDDNILARMTTSVVSGRTMEQIARGDDAGKTPRGDSKRSPAPKKSERPDRRVSRPSCRSRHRPPPRAGRSGGTWPGLMGLSRP
jgi:bifunctional non-homologous end joining protein LigD